MGKGASSGVSEIHYAPYLEDAHLVLIIESQNIYNQAVYVPNPYGDPADPTVQCIQLPDIDDAFFTAGYTITSFPSLFDMFGKFMAGLDVESLFSQIEDDFVNGPVISDAISAEATYLQDDIDLVAYPRMLAGLSDMNAVMSNQPMTTLALLQAQKLKTISKYSADLKSNAMSLSVNRWAKHLEWNGGVIDHYMKLNQLYWATKLDVTEKQTDFDTKWILWNFTLLDHMRVNIAALNGAHASAVKGQDSKSAMRMAGILGGISTLSMLVGGATGNPVMAAGGAGGIGSMIGGFMRNLGFGGGFNAGQMQGAANAIAGDVMGD